MFFFCIVVCFGLLGLMMANNRFGQSVLDVFVSMFEMIVCGHSDIPTLGGF